MTYEVLDMVWSLGSAESRQAGKGSCQHSNMKIVSRYIVKGSVRLSITEQYCSRTLSRDMSKYVQTKTRTCGICTTSFER